MYCLDHTVMSQNRLSLSHGDPLPRQQNRLYLAWRASPAPTNLFIRNIYNAGGKVYFHDIEEEKEAKKLKNIFDKIPK